MPARPISPVYLAPVAVELHSEGHIAVVEEAVVDVHTTVPTANDLAGAIDPGLERTNAHTSALRYVWGGSEQVSSSLKQYMHVHGDKRSTDMTLWEHIRAP